MFLYLSPTPADRWLRTTFANRAWLLGKVAEAVTRAPIDLLVPSPAVFGRAFENALHYDLARALPHVYEMRAFPRIIAREFARLAGYAPPTGNPQAPWPAWERRTDRLVVRRRLHYPVTALAIYHDVFYRVGDGTAAASRAFLTGPHFRAHLLGFVAGHELAFLAFMASYDHAVRPLLHALGPAIAAPQLPGGKIADLMVGRTMVEIKTGRLAYRDDHENLIDQLLAYGLLSQLTDQPATHVAAYLARYQALLMYPFHRLARRCAGKRFDVLDAARTYLRIQNPGTPCPLQADVAGVAGGRRPVLGQT